MLQISFKRDKIKTKIKLYLISNGRYNKYYTINPNPGHKVKVIMKLNKQIMQVNYTNMSIPKRKLNQSQKI